jgi:hypothetical protein
MTLESLILQVWEVCPEITLKEEKGKKPARKTTETSSHLCNLAE